jgi:hypothetical protein
MKRGEIREVWYCIVRTVILDITQNNVCPETPGPFKAWTPLIRIHGATSHKSPILLVSHITGRTESHVRNFWTGSANIKFTRLFCAMTNKCIIISQNITLLHVSTLSPHLQGVCNQSLTKLHK